MRKFILTNPMISGQIELIFQNSLIALIDFRGTDMTARQRQYFIQHCPLGEVGLSDFLKGTQFTCVESDIEITFEMFWNKYNMKLDRKRTLALWDKLSKTKQVAAFYGIDKYERYLRRTPWRNKMEPKTYLKNERWEDELR